MEKCVVLTVVKGNNQCKQWFDMHGCYNNRSVCAVVKNKKKQDDGSLLLTLLFTDAQVRGTGLVRRVGASSTQWRVVSTEYDTYTPPKQICTPNATGGFMVGRNWRARKPTSPKPKLLTGGLPPKNVVFNCDLNFSVGNVAANLLYGNRIDCLNGKLTFQMKQDHIACTIDSPNSVGVDTVAAKLLDGNKIVCLDGKIAFKLKGK